MVSGQGSELDLTGRSPKPRSHTKWEVPSCGPFPFTFLALGQGRCLGLFSMAASTQTPEPRGREDNGLVKASIFYQGQGLCLP